VDIKPKAASEGGNDEVIKYEHFSLFRGDIVTYISPDFMK